LRLSDCKIAKRSSCKRILLSYAILENITDNGHVL
jgi:hypothetical protein